MPRRWEFHTMVGDGPSAQRVGYSPKKRGATLAVVFNGPDGGRLQKATDCRKPDIDFETEAARIISRAYAKLHPATIAAAAKKTTWEAAIKDVEDHPGTLRPKTIVAFVRAQQTLREILEHHNIKTSSPSDITPELAARFGRLLKSTKYKRGAKGIERQRSDKTCDYYRRSLSALWGQYLKKDRQYVTANVWEAMDAPKLEKSEPNVPTAEEVSQFLGWVHTKYPAWERLHALLNLKLLSACRSADIVQLKSDQVADGKVVFKAHQVKTRAGRSVPLDDAFFQNLRALAGRVWLWEEFQADCMKFRSSPNNRKLARAFDPESVQDIIENIFREYSDGHPDRRRISPHRFRAYGITTMTQATGSVDLTAQALGINAQTARKYYLDATRAFDASAAFKLASEKMVPKPKLPEEKPPEAQTGS